MSSFWQDLRANWGKAVMIIILYALMAALAFGLVFFVDAMNA